jgi:hypothetical protein
MTLPFDNASALDVLVIGTKITPGVVTLSGHDRKKNWDTQKAKGNVGATNILNGDDPGEFDASFYLAGDGENTNFEESDDFARWEEMQAYIESTTNGPKPFALPIFHPDLARQKYTEIINGGVGGLVHDGKGGATVKVHFVEYRPAKKKVATKAIGKPSGAGGAQFGPPPPPDPNQAAKDELAQLVAIARTP